MVSQYMSRPETHVIHDIFMYYMGFTFTDGGAQQELPALDCQVVVDFAQSGQLSRRDLRLEGCGALALGVAGLGTTLNVRDRGGSGRAGRRHLPFGDI